MSEKQFKVLIAATGSVAAMKIPLIISGLLESNEFYNRKLMVRLIVTEHAKHFFSTSDLPAGIEIFDDSDEWKLWQSRGDPVLHIDLGKWADIMIIAPLDANTLAKMSQGICDNLLTCTTRAWDRRKPLIFCPAMNTRMWEHPITSEQIAKLKSWDHIEIPPISKQLMCGDFGNGAMAEVSTLIEYIQKIYQSSFQC